MKHWLLPTFAIVLSACTAARPVIYSDPSFNPATVKRLVFVVEDRSDLGELAQNPALMRTTEKHVKAALVAKGYEVTSDADYVLLAKVEPVQRSKRYIPFPITVRKLPVSCEILARDTKQQLRRAVVDGYRPHSSRTAVSWINDPAKLYPIAIQDACEQVLAGAQ